MYVLRRACVGEGKGTRRKARKEMATQSIGRAEKGLPHQAPPLAPWIASSCALPCARFLAFFRASFDSLHDSNPNIEMELDHVDWMSWYVERAIEVILVQTSHELCIRN